MIKITFSYKNNEIENILIQGHANQNEYGKDIVCSAVSSLLFSCLNTLKSTNKDEIIIKNGYAKLDKLTNKSSHDKIVINVLINGLIMISEQYGKYISMSKEQL